MRVLQKSDYEKPAQPEGDRDVSEAAKNADKEIVFTCTRCQSVIGFKSVDEGVTLDNEGDYNLDCPVCDTPLMVGKTTGIVIQRQPNGD